MFKYTLDNKRYHTLNYYLKTRFNSKVFKVPLNAGFGCPNNDTCIYCTKDSSANITKNEASLIEQFNSNVITLEKKWPNSKYIIYFQAGTNTFCTVEELKEKVEPLLTLNKVVGLSIATRPDSLTNDMINYLSDLNERTFLTVELGLQTSNDLTLKMIKRGHDSNCFKNAVNKLHEKNIFVVAHIINGLPYETKEDMLNTIKFLNKLDIDGIKIHMLYISKNTEIESMYNKEQFHVLTKDEYIDIVIDQLELLNETVVIERITGDPIKEDLITPCWLLKKFVVLNDIDKEMVRRNTYQGLKF